MNTKLFGYAILALLLIIVAGVVTADETEKNLKDGRYLPFKVYYEDSSQDYDELSDTDYSDDDKLYFGSKDEVIVRKYSSRRWNSKDESYDDADLPSSSINLNQESLKTHEDSDFNDKPTKIADKSLDSPQTASMTHYSDGNSSSIDSPKSAPKTHYSRDDSSPIDSSKSAFMNEYSRDDSSSIDYSKSASMTEYSSDDLSSIDDSRSIAAFSQPSSRWGYNLDSPSEYEESEPKRSDSHSQTEGKDIDADSSEAVSNEDISNDLLDENELPFINDFDGESPVFTKISVSRLSKAPYDYKKIGSQNSVDELAQIYDGAKKMNHLVSKHMKVLQSISLKKIDPFVNLFDDLLRDTKNLLENAEQLQIRISEENHVDAPTEKPKFGKKRMVAKVKKMTSLPKKLVSKIKTLKFDRKQIMAKAKKMTSLPKKLAKKIKTLKSSKKEKIIDAVKVKLQQSDIDSKVKSMRLCYDLLKNNYRRLTTIRMLKPVQIWSSKDTRIPVLDDTSNQWSERSTLMEDKTTPPLMYSTDILTTEIMNTDIWKPIIVNDVNEWMFVKAKKELNADTVLKMPFSPQMIGGVSLLLQGIQMIPNLDVDHHINREIMILKHEGSTLLGQLQQTMDEDSESSQISSLKLRIKSVIAEYISLILSKEEIIAEMNKVSMWYQIIRPITRLSSLDEFKPINVITDDEKAFAAQEQNLEFLSVLSQTHWSTLIGGLSLLTQSIQTIDSLTWNCPINNDILTLQLEARKLIVSLEQERKNTRNFGHDSRVNEKIDDIITVMNKYNRILIKANL